MTGSSQTLAQAIARLTSLHDGEAAVSEVVTFGGAAVPALRSLLLQREPSGLFQVRCRAVEALAALRAYDVLVEFLNDRDVADDPVESLGDDAVVNAAAQGLKRLHDERVFRLLMRLAQRPALTGVIDALGAHCRAEAISVLIAALEDDASRGTAEAALLKMGQAARTALIMSAQQRRPSPGCESESSLRRRRSTLKLLDRIGISDSSWPELRGLVWEKVLRDELEQSLITHFDKLSPILFRCADAVGAYPSRDPDVDRLLQRVCGLDASSCRPSAS